MNTIPNPVWQGRVQRDRYDAIVIGARVAGASAAMLLARGGARVLLVDSAPVIGDTLSTHALLRPGAALLARWGLLDRLLAAGTPLIRRASYQYGTEGLSFPIRAAHGVPGLVGPRRSLLDPMLIEAARESGAEVRLGRKFLGCRRDGEGRVTGVIIENGGMPQEVYADLVIGADGRTSAVAQSVEAPVRRLMPERAFLAMSYFAGLPGTGYDWYFGNRVAAGVFPTNGGVHCVFAMCRPNGAAARFADGLVPGMARILHDFDPELAARIAETQPEERPRRYLGAPGHERQRSGPGWALIGDAACFKDPITAHGMTDALLDAQSLADAVLAGAPDGYGPAREAQAAEICAVTAQIAGLNWDLARVQALHARFNAAVKAETVALRAPLRDAGDLAA